MAMPKKGTRLITVDGVRYRWIASGYDRYLGEETDARIQVQSLDPAGAVLSVRAVDWRETVLPSHVAHVIRTAIRKGWKPLEPGPPFVRDVELDPFGGQEFDPKWRTEAVIGLAAKMRDTNDLAALPILADALEEAGCQNEALLTYCREQWHIPEARRVILLNFANL
jgi:hypothetical protein